METIIVAFAECPRCGQPHEKLVGKRFHRPAGIYTHWALCPVTYEPIIASPQEIKPQL